MSDEEVEWGNIADYANSAIVRDENEEDEDQDEISDEDSEEPTIPENKDVYNRVALLQKLEEIALPKSTPWSATFALNSGATHEGISSEDDFNREVSFYKQAVAGCTAARSRFEAEGFKYKRPTDYFAEMVKADTHMAKVRQNLLDQQKRLEAVEERRRQRELKKFGKKVQIEKEQARAHQKKQEIEAVKKWRKEQKNKTPETREDISVLLEDEDRLQKGANKDKDKKKEAKEAKRVNLKRKRKDEQYGYGGPKKRSKRNEAESTDDMSGFSVRKNKSVSKEFLPATGFGARKGGPRGGGGKRGPPRPAYVKRVRKN